METVAVTVAERDTRSNREILLRDFVRFSWKATRGLATAAEAEGKELVGQMVTLGRVTPAEGERILATLMGRMQKSRETFEARVDASVKRAVERLGEISMREVTTLRTQAAELEKRVDTLAGSRRGK